MTDNFLFPLLFDSSVWKQPLKANVYFSIFLYILKCIVDIKNFYNENSIVFLLYEVFLFKIQSAVLAP